MMHPSTVRQRLVKFEEVTRPSVRHTEVIVELWWASATLDGRRGRCASVKKAA